MKKSGCEYCDGSPLPLLSNLEIRERRRLANTRWRRTHPGYSKLYRSQQSLQQRRQAAAKRRLYLAQENVAKRHQDTNRLWNQKNFLKHLLVGAKNRAQRAGREFSLRVFDLSIPAICPILGIPLVIHHETSSGLGRGKNRFDDSPSLDRIDSTKGYVPGNVRVISWRANRVKNDGTAEEHEKIARYIRDNHVL